MLAGILASPLYYDMRLFRMPLSLMMYARLSESPMKYGSSGRLHSIGLSTDPCEFPPVIVCVFWPAIESEYTSFMLLV